MKNSLYLCIFALLLALASGNILAQDQDSEFHSALSDNFILAIGAFRSDSAFTVSSTRGREVDEDDIDFGDSIGEKKPTKVKPVHAAKRIQRACLVLFNRIFRPFQGDLSSFIRFARSPSIHCSIQMKTSVQTVCGQANPHQRRPASAVKKKRDKPAVIMSRAR